MRFLRFLRYKTMLSKISYCFFFFCLVNTLFAQQDSLAQIIPNTDSLALQIDSVIQTEKKRKSQDYPNPKRAAFLSLALPGAGHIYNKKYWKAPVSIAAISASIFFIDRNTKMYRLTQRSYLDALVREQIRTACVSTDDAPCLSPAEELPFLLDSGTAGTLYTFKRPNWQGFFDRFSEDNSTSVKNLRDDFDKYRQWAWVSLLGVHLLNSAWSFVDAHFLDFNIDEDLSLRLQPSVQTSSFAPAPGVGLVLVFGE